MRILYIDIDTLRPDHLGCYGYSRETSPNIDKIAREGVVFTNYYCSDAPCLPSRTALLTGKFGIRTGVVGHGGSTADLRTEGAVRQFKSKLEFETLPGVLSAFGLKTISISPFAARHGAWSFYAGWDEIHNTGLGGLEGAQHIISVALDWIKYYAHNDQWFLHINYWDPHTPYRAPVELGNPFQDQAIPEWITEDILEGHRKLVGPHTAGNINMFTDTIDHVSQKLPEGTKITPPKIESMDDLRQIFDGYDLGIRHTDDNVGKIFAALEDLGVMDDLIVIISSDHGENLGELGIYAEHGTADQSTSKIPMIIRWPGMSSGLIDDGLHYNLDLLPTLAEILGIKPFPEWDGQSYASTLFEGKVWGHKYLILSQCAHVCQRSVRFDQWLYIRTYHDGFHLFSNEMLFDLENDPHEQFNLASKYPEICRQAVYYLNHWHDGMMKTIDSAVDPLWLVLREGGPYHTLGALEPYCKSLEGSDREWAIEEYKRKYPKEFRSHQ